MYGLGTLRAASFRGISNERTIREVITVPDLPTPTERETPVYEYGGYLSTLLDAPDWAARDSVDSVVFTADDLSKWRTRDLAHAAEWKGIPVRKEIKEAGVLIEGDFREVVRIDSLSPNDPRYWVPLSTVGLDDDRFPIDATQYPIIEVTYRCASARAHPTWMWAYEGGSYFGALPKSDGWRTEVRLAQHFGFPSQIESVVIRLYSAARSVEALEIESVRFRALTPAEHEALQKNRVEIEGRKVSKKYDALDEFMPFGVYMDAELSKRLATMLGITHTEYWDLVFEDLVAHEHNAVALAHVDHLSPTEWSALLEQAEPYGIRFVPRHEFPVSGSAEQQQKVLSSHVQPYAEFKSIFANSFSGEPIETDFSDLLSARDRIEAADPNHPVAIIARYPNAYPLFAPFVPVSGVGHFTSRRPWDLGAMVKTHVPLADSQQFWVAAPAFVYPTNTPEWSTCPEMRLMNNLAFANGARGWFAYSYHNDPVWLRGRVQRTLTGPFLTFSDLWMELMERARLGNAIAPLYLKARRVDDVDSWYTNSFVSEVTDEPSPGIPAISLHQLAGDGFTLYIMVSNNVREMTGVNFDIPKGSLGSNELYDLTEYVTSRVWAPMPHKGHLEMFPGQSHIMLAADPSDGEQWRDMIASRLIDRQLLRLQADLKLARAYDLNYGPIEDKLNHSGSGSKSEHLETVHAAYGALLNLIYSAEAIHVARSKIIEASSAVCACDGALCRLMGRGKIETAREMGAGVLPLAREFTALRLELRRGKGTDILAMADDLSQRSLSMLDRIRAEY